MLSAWASLLQSPPPGRPSLHGGHGSELPGLCRLGRQDEEESCVRLVARVKL